MVLSVVSGLKGAGKIVVMVNEDVMCGGTSARAIGEVFMGGASDNYA